MLRLDIKPGESVRIGDGANAVVITLEDKSGRNARIAFEADRSVKITRINKEEKTPAQFLRQGLSAGAVA
jgi:sRNA-binding carbon storage regulator CsrA